MRSLSLVIFFFFFTDTATTEIYTLSLHDALPIFTSHELVVLFCAKLQPWKRPTDLLRAFAAAAVPDTVLVFARSEEHTSELQSPVHLVCRLLLEKKKINTHTHYSDSFNISTQRPP